MAEPIILTDNPYAGVNPHLNSELQTPGSQEEGLSIWPSFHSDHMTNIAEFLNAQLPPNYVARTEQSLQIRAEDIEAEIISKRTHKPQPDVTIYGQSSTGAATATAPPRGTVLRMSLEDTLDISEDFVKAITIRDTRLDRRLGRVVTRIELLSPSNKRGHVGYEPYRKGRLDALFSGTPLIELDYLHESLPPVLNYPVYPEQPNSYAYNVFISDPRPSVRKGDVLAHGFDVDAAFPLVTIPLADSESLEFDFGAVYHYTFQRGRWGQMVNYAELPVRFETYSPADQARIQAQMAALRESLPRESSN
jgi:hypothetical protein